MKEIILTKLSLTNFKGIRSLEIDFGRKTDIRGANASGKTTVFDAFRWLLFGKSSDDRKDFGIKTYDEQGNVIPRIPHEVTGVLRINGEEITLRKCLVEKWTKKRGSAEETYSGNLLECYWNDVPTSVTEYNAKISGICDEQLFKLITNPWYFTAQRKDVQRAMLFDLAGNIDEEDIVGGNEDFAALLRNLTGKTLDEYKREIVAKKRRVKDSVESIPARIDECNRSMPEKGDENKTLRIRGNNVDDVSKYAKYLTWDSAPESKKAEIDWLQKHILSKTFTPNIEFDNMKSLSNISGKALKQMMLLADIKANRHKEQHDELLDRTSNLILAIIGNVLDISLREECQRCVIQHEFQEPFGENITETIDNIAKARDAAILSAEGAVELNPLIKDHKQELERLAHEEEQASQNQRDLFGLNQTKEDIYGGAE